MEFLKAFLTPAALVVAIPVIIRAIVQYTKLLDKIDSIQNKLIQEVEVRAKISASHTERCEYLWGEILRCRGDLTRTETALNNHTGIAGHTAAMQELSELHERVDRLKSFTLQLNDRVASGFRMEPLDPSKQTFS